MKAESKLCFGMGLFCLWIALLPGAWADGKLTHLSGGISIKKADGRSTIGLVGTRIAEGDTVVTAPGAYVRVELSDGTEVVLRPDSALKLVGYQFVPTNPAEDKLKMDVVKGGLRTVTGWIGKRNSPSDYELKTPTATVGIRGTQFDLRVCQANCGALPDGTYLAVRFGAIEASNALGAQPVLAGQIIFIPPNQPPVLLPRDPGVGFSPPPGIPKLDERKKSENKGNGSNGGEGAAGTPSGQKLVTGQSSKLPGQSNGADEGDASCAIQ